MNTLLGQQTLIWLEIYLSADPSAKRPTRLIEVFCGNHHIQCLVWTFMVINVSPVAKTSLRHEQRRKNHTSHSIQSRALSRHLCLFNYSIFALFSRIALPSTEMELSAIAAPAIMGLR